MYISIDLDDTLLNSKKQMSTFNLEVLKECRKKGHKIIINTARNHFMCKTLLNELVYDYFVLNAGSQILDASQHQIMAFPIKHEILASLSLELLRVSDGISFQDDEVLYTSDEKFTRPDIRGFDFSTEYNYPCYKILVKGKNHEQISDIAKKYDLDYTSYFGGVFSRINASDATKWKAIEHIVEYDHGNINECISFGDDYGDLEMILNSRIGVAMSNSVDEVLKKAKYHTLSNDLDGVGRFLVDYFKLDIGEKL